MGRVARRLELQGTGRATSISKRRGKPWQALASLGKLLGKLSGRNVARGCRVGGVADQLRGRRPHFRASESLPPGRAYSLWLPKNEAHAAQFRVRGCGSSERMGVETGCSPWSPVQTACGCERLISFKCGQVHGVECRPGEGELHGARHGHECPGLCPHRGWRDSRQWS